nr:hypothetical protein [Clostridia bacterium]
MKKLSLLLAIMMLLSSLVFPAMAEQPEVIKESASGFYYIEANGDQVRLSAADKDIFFQADGLWFKDLNGNGALDIYEDWRQDINARVADLLSQMTPEEKGGTLIFACVAGKNGSTVTDFNQPIAGFQGDAGSASVIGPDHPAITSDELYIEIGGANFIPTKYQIQTMNVTTFIAALTGHPKDQQDLFNRLQSYAEDTRLGIPATFSGDRSYNTWGGMIDMAHYAFGVAHDPELLYNLVSEYAKESVAIGYHQVFHGYGNEIGSWYGDEVNYIAEMSAIETKAYDDYGFQSHSKHFIARGGRNAYVSAKSPADLIDSWMVGWKAVVDAGTRWIMTNNNVGVTPGLQGYMDKHTYDILRNDLGYEGVVCLDWPLSVSSLMTKTGVTQEDVDVSTLTAVERYAMILNAGVDMFSCYGATPGTDWEAYPEVSNRAMPHLIVEAVNLGLVTAEDLDIHVGRVLYNKFMIGSFEDCFRDWSDALAIIGSDAFIAEGGLVLPLTNEEINLYRRAEVTAMEEELMVKSTVMLKNDGILPLQAGVKIYADSNNASIKASDAAALAAYGTLVETFAEADVVIFHTTSFDEAYEYAVEDAAAAGKPFILIYEGTNKNEPYGAQVAAANAVLMQTYINTPDHGSSAGSYFRYTTGSITADMLFGVKDPGGSTLFEIPYEADEGKVAWGELQYDIGVDNDVRLYMAMLAKENPTIVMPKNLGDVLYTADFGMSYAKPADIQLSLLTVDKEAVTTQTESNGRIRTSTVIVNKTQKAGVPFEISFVAQNFGGDGHITAQVKDGDAVIAEKFVALDGDGAWRVITIELTLEAGEHVISIGDMAETIVVE